MIKISLSLILLLVGFEHSAKAEDLSIEVEIAAPGTNYAIEIQDVRRVGDELWVLSKVRITTAIGDPLPIFVRDKVEISIAGSPKVKHFITGKNWNWADPKTVTYLPKEGMTDEKWKDAKVVWARPKEQLQ